MKTSRKAILSETLMLSVGVLFILLVFQPFGTDDFEHPYKYEQLLGYGLLIFLLYPLLRLLFDRLLSGVQNHWYRIVGAVVISSLLLIVPCFFYYSFLIVDELDLSHFPSFAMFALGISTPFVSLIIYDKWIRQKAIRKQAIAPPLASVELQGENKEERYHFVIEDMRYLQSQGNYVKVVFVKADEQQQVLIRSSLSGLMDQLPNDQFIRTHRSYVIQKASFSSLLQKDGKYFVQDQTKEFIIPVSRTYLRPLKEILNDFR